MAQHILGPLYYERMGRVGDIVMFVHPNPMDQSCWLFQMAHLSTWYRCIAVDIPGYGRSPKATPGLTMTDMAEACWEAIDDAFPSGERAILVGCSVGSSILPYMHHLRPNKTAAMVLSGTGYVPGKEFAKRRIEAYTANGIDYRWAYTFEDLVRAFVRVRLRVTLPNFLRNVMRQPICNQSLYQFQAMQRADAEDHYDRIKCPTIILTGTEDSAHASALELKQRIPGCEFKILPGAGHACQIEQPWLFDRFMLEFLKRHGL